MCVRRNGGAMRKFLAVVLVLIFGVLVAQSQRDLTRSKLDDAITEMETGRLRLYFLDALDGKPVKDAKVVLYGLDTFYTDNDGKIEFLPIEDSYKQAVRFEKKSYISVDFDVDVVLGRVFFNRFSVSPVMDLTQFRVVLDWGREPADLDAHFIKQNDYHISYRNMKTLSDGKGKLDRDDMDGYGPETITVQEISSNSSYEYYVFDYSNRNNRNSKALSQSGATVKIYGQNKLLHIFNVPTNPSGRKWNVFKIENSQIIPINSIE